MFPLKTFLNSSRPSIDHWTICSMSFLRKSRSSIERFLLIPPGMAPVPWIFLPEVALITSWPYLRIRMAILARSGCFWATPITLRIAGSASKPNNRSGEARWKKCRTWLWKVCP